MIPLISWADWKSRFMAELMSLTGCMGPLAGAAADGAHQDWEDGIDPEEAAYGEAEAWQDSA